MGTQAKIPKGTRDFLPEEAAKRNYIFNTIKSVYQRFGYMPVETPSMELLETLTGKYGEEGDRLIFKILNQGDEVKKADLQALEDGNLAKFSNSLAGKALRFDLTVPFARMVVQHRNDITFPFKRYQIQPVWRGDRPQKGRYREFYQCDADVIGSNSLWNEVELCQIIDAVFAKLNLPVLLKLNNRKILAGIANSIGAEGMFIPFTVALDKLDKIGAEKVLTELGERGLHDWGLQQIKPILEQRGSNDERLDLLKSLLNASKIGQKGIEEMEFILAQIKALGITATEVELDLTLARGLNYYTGTIFEVKAKTPEFTSSILGGGRYDDLTGIFGLKDVSGVGISFGADRIYDVLKLEGLFPEQLEESTRLMFINFGEKEAAQSMLWLQQIRAAGINAELYPDAKQMGKQMKYADKKGIEWAAIVGSNEIEEGKINLKNLNSGEQEMLTVEEVIEKVAGNE